MATIERIRKGAVGRKGIFASNPDSEKVVTEAYENGEHVVISYKDRKGRRTRRMIKPLIIETDPYSGVRRIKSFCYLRLAERIFLLERITDAIPADIELSVISEDESSLHG